MRPEPALFGGGKGGELLYQLCCPLQDFVRQDPFPGPWSDNRLPGARCQDNLPVPPGLWQGWRSCVKASRQKMMIRK